MNVSNINAMIGVSVPSGTKYPFVFPSSNFIALGIAFKAIKKNNMEIKNQKEHLNALLAEVEILKLRFEPTDTGHLRTTVNVLEERIQEILNSL